MANNIKLLKMITSEEVLAEVTEETSSTISVKNPVRVVVVPSKTDPKTPNVGYVPWTEFSDEKEFTIHKAHVIIITRPLQEFINQYNSLFGGIIAPTSKLIVP
jgi:hypothetical protein